MKINAFNQGVLYQRYTPKLLLIMKLTTFILILALSQVSAKTYSQITLKAENVQITEVLKQIEAQSGFVFLYEYGQISDLKVSVNVKNVSITAALEECLENTPLSFNIVGSTRTITIKPKPFSINEKLINKPQNIDVRGKVVDESGRPLVGATITVKGLPITVLTNELGDFYIRNIKEKTSIQISYLGYKVKNLLASNDLGTIVMEMENANLKEVVINTGLFDRKADSFTGAVATFKGAELRAITNQNLFSALAVLDPSFRIVDNVEFGSDPNRLPEMILRGPTGVPDLNATYQNAPNLPLFILDGFETTVQKIYDLNMNMVASVTLLKDASAKAIYGAKAGNGVVVIETVKPAAGKFRVSYSASADITAPDLSSYNMANSAQKLEAEVLGGMYKSTSPSQQFELIQLYSVNKKAVLDGVDTYWLSQPLQNGVGQRHNLYLDGGNETVRYGLSGGYNKVSGVMKGSERTTINGSFNFQYRVKNLSFRNNFMIDKNTAVNSPFGAFSNYSRMNPYWRINDDQGRLIQSYRNITGAEVFNPLYDASLNTKDQSEYTTITENFYGEWTMAKNLRFTGRIGLTLNNNNSDLFRSALHSDYFQIGTNSPEYLLRGRYSVGNGKSNALVSDLGFAYSFQIKKHQVYANLMYNIQQSTRSSTGMTMVGFPNDRMDDISFGSQYLPGSKASGAENTSRALGVTSALNYSFDNRFLADFSYRANGSSQFGANKRWGGFWSVGLGYNLHNEKFIKELKFVDQFKLRASTGTTGTQNFSSYQSIATYRYNTDRVYNGDLGLLLMALANPNLKWQQIMDNNIGLDVGLFNKIQIRADYYLSDTKDLLSDQTLAPSSGFDSYRENVGETRNKGFQINVSGRIYNSEATRSSLNIFASIVHNKNKIRKVSNSLRKINENQDDKLNNGTATVRRMPVTRFEEGQSISAIWAVRSLGIDPANGQEIFLKKDGSRTYLWDVKDQVVVGDNLAKYNGSFGLNWRYQGLSVNLAFTYRIGGQIYNSTLVSKLENANLGYNIDARLLEGRWREPGQYSLYKDIADMTVTRPTSRFVQDQNELVFSSINTSYDLSRTRFVKRLGMSSLSAGLTLNDLARISRVQAERGLDYPFSRNISVSLQANF